MKILAVDTSTEYCSVALLEDTELIDEINDNSNHSHNKKLFNNIKLLLTNNNLTLRNIELLAIGNGPGSFTGLRVGMSAMKGISMASGIKLIPIRSIDSVALKGMSELNLDRITVLLEGKQKDMFKATYSLEHKKVKLISDIKITGYEEKLTVDNVSIGNISTNIIKIKDYYNDFFPSAYYIGKIAYQNKDNYSYNEEIIPEYYKDFKINKSKKKPLIESKII